MSTPRSSAYRSRSQVGKHVAPGDPPAHLAPAPGGLNMAGLVGNKNAVDVFLTRICNSVLSFVPARNTIPVSSGRSENREQNAEGTKAGGRGCPSEGRPVRENTHSRRLQLRPAEPCLRVGLSPRCARSPLSMPHTSPRCHRLVGSVSGCAVWPSSPRHGAPGGPHFSLSPTALGRRTDAALPGPRGDPWSPPGDQHPEPTRRAVTTGDADAAGTEPRPDSGGRAQVGCRPGGRLRSLVSLTALTPL